MEVYRAVVEALGFVVTGGERGLVALLKEELKVARRIVAMREAAREGPRVGRMSRGSGSSRAASLEIVPQATLLVPPAPRSP